MSRAAVRERPSAWQRRQRERLEAERIKAELEAQLREAQKLEALGTLAGGVAHDFNNILGAIVAFTELAQMDIDSPEEVLGHLGELRKASDRARDLVRQILTFSRRQKQERRPLVWMAWCARRCSSCVRPCPRRSRSKRESIRTPRRCWPILRRSTRS